jgi:hypothetical protein
VTGKGIFPSGSSHELLRFSALLQQPFDVTAQL